MDNSDLLEVLKSEALKRNKGTLDFWHPIFAQIIIDSCTDVRKANGKLGVSEVIESAHIASSRIIDFIELAAKKYEDDF